MCSEKQWSVWIIFLLLKKCSLVYSEDVVGLKFYDGGSKTQLKSKLDCSYEIHKLFCSFRCRGMNFLCLQNQCFCYGVRDMESNFWGTVPHSRTEYILDIDDNNGYSSVVSPSSWPPKKKIDTTELLYSEEPFSEQTDHLPVRRHHITHFCPNLDVAAQCIRTCMKVAKPAFCGKDHVCYCGHKYNDYDKDIKVNVSTMREEWKNLYNYLGFDQFKTKQKLVKFVSSSEESDETKEKLNKKAEDETTSSAVDDSSVTASIYKAVRSVGDTRDGLRTSVNFEDSIKKIKKRAATSVSGEKVQLKKLKKYELKTY